MMCEHWMVIKFLWPPVNVGQDVENSLSVEIETKWCENGKTTLVSGGALSLTFTFNVNVEDLARNGQHGDSNSLNNGSQVQPAAPPGLWQTHSANNSLGSQRCVGTWAQTWIKLGITPAPEYTHMNTNDQFMSEHDTEIWSTRLDSLRKWLLCMWAVDHRRLPWAYRVS